MGTSVLYLRNTVANGITDSGRTVCYDLISTAGAAVDIDTVTLTNSGTEIAWTQSAGGSTICWISGRVPSGGMNLSTVDMSVWGLESNANDNAGFGCMIYRYIPGTPTITALGAAVFEDGAELPRTTPTEQTWAADVNDTAFAENDRVLVVIYATDVGTMTTGTAELHFNAAAAATGDSLVTLTHTEASITFKAETVAPRTIDKPDTATIRDIATVFFNPMFLEMMKDTATVKDLLTILLNPMLVPSKVDTVTVQDIATMFFNPKFMGLQVDSATIRDIAQFVIELFPIQIYAGLLKNEDGTYLLTEDGGYFRLEGLTNEQITISDLASVLLDINPVAGIERSTIRDILSIFFDPMFLEAKVDTATIQDVFSLLFNPMFMNVQTDRATIQDIVSIITDFLIVSGQDSATVNDSFSIFFNPHYLGVKTEQATISDVFSIFFSILFQSSVDTATIADVVTLILNKLNVYPTEQATLQDAATLAYDKLVKHTSDTLTVRDILILNLDVLNATGVDSITIKDVLTIQMDILNLLNTDSATVKDVFSIFFSCFNMITSDTLTVKDSPLVQMNQYNVETYETLTIKDTSLVQMDQYNIENYETLTFQDILTLILYPLIEIVRIQDDSLTLADQLYIILDMLNPQKQSTATIRDSFLVSLIGSTAVGYLGIPNLPHLGTLPGIIGGRHPIHLH